MKTISIILLAMIITICCDAQEINNLIEQKSYYDNLRSNGIATQRIFIRTTTGELKKLKEEQWNDNTTLMYKIFDKGEKIISIDVIEKEGDWSGRHLYYFDQEGIIFSYVHNLKSFNTHCADTLELKTTFFFDKKSDVLSQKLVAMNELGETITSDSCIYKNPYNHYFYSNLEEFMLKVENYQAIDVKY